MKKLILSAALALCTGAAFAQTNQAQTSVGQPTDTNEPVFKGCLTGTKNAYMLKTVDGKTYRLHSDKDIDDHLNKNVEVRGSVKTEGGDHSKISKEAGIQEIDVADLKSVSNDSCVGPMAGVSNTGSKSVATGAESAKDASAGVNASATTGAAATTEKNTTASSTTATAGTQTNANTMPQSDQAAQTDVGGRTDKDEPLYKGCVTGKKDHYVLTAENGERFRLHSDKDINEHVGDQVEIRGTLKPEGDGHKVSANSKWKGELDVADIKTVEDGACKNNK